MDKQQWLYKSLLGWQLVDELTEKRHEFFGFLRWFQAQRFDEFWESKRKFKALCSHKEKTKQVKHRWNGKHWFVELLLVNFNKFYLYFILFLVDFDWLMMINNENNTIIRSYFHTIFCVSIISLLLCYFILRDIFYFSKIKQFNFDRIFTYEIFKFLKWNLYNCKLRKSTISHNNWYFKILKRFVKKLR